jgi:hypothetical protein
VRFGDLIDQATFDETALVLGWSREEKTKIRRWSKDPSIVELWSQQFQRTGELPPRELIDGYFFSSLIRGRYYQALDSGSYVWHPFRNYVIDAITELSELRLYRDRLIEVYLAGMICRGAMEESSGDDVIVSWAENIRRLKSHTLKIPPETDHERACERAVCLAKSCDLHFRWPKLDRIIESTIHLFVLPIIGMAAGLYIAAETASHGVSILAEGGSQVFLRGYVEQVAAQIQAASSGSSINLRRIAKDGTQRIFAVVKDELVPQDK